MRNENPPSGNRSGVNSTPKSTRGKPTPLTFFLFCSTCLKKLGRDGANALRTRLKQVLEAENLEALRFAAGAWHELAGDRKGELACRVSGRVRLIFMPANDPIPTKPDGGLDWSAVTAVVNLEIVDYH